MYLDARGLYNQNIPYSVSMNKYANHELFQETNMPLECRGNGLDHNLVKRKLLFLREKPVSTTELHYRSNKQEAF